MIQALVVGLGHMGISHALALHRMAEVEIVALVNRSSPELPEALQGYRLFDNYHKALLETRPELVCIASYTETHAEYAMAAMRQGAHVFVEKPLAATMEDAREVVATAKATTRKLVVGYILRHHPGWQCFIEKAQGLGGPYVFRFNLNQQSTGSNWQTHKNLMRSTSPLVDCGVHYVDVMCQISNARPIRVHGIGARLSDEIDQRMYNFGQLQVAFDDESIGWYEVGWGPMVSEAASFIKDVVSPQGAVSILAADKSNSDDIEGHTSLNVIRVHHSDGKDEDIRLDQEPDHQQLCDSEQRYMIQAIENNIQLEQHMQDALDSLHICLAADYSINSKSVVEL